MFLRPCKLKRNLEIILLIFFIIFCFGLSTRHILKSAKFETSKPDVKENLPRTDKNIKEISPRKDKNIKDKFQKTDKNVESELILTTELPIKDQLKSILKCCDKQLQLEKLQYGQYYVLKNYIRGRLSINMECAETITYTANGDYTFIGNLATVVKRWLAPISFAIYAPGYDYNTTMDSIQYARNCLPESELIRDYVTFHIYFPNNHMPSYIALNEEEALDWPYDCESEEVPYENVERSEMYKTQANLTYPINVGRNIARKAVNTYYIMACDIELHPSLGLVEQFLNMVLYNSTFILEGDNPKVFPLPVFEIHENSTFPDSKEHLQEMLGTKTAIPFHYYVCPNCHLVPEQNEWVEANSTEDMEVFTVGQRHGKFAAWEPFYISDNKEPLFDERVTWEGQSDKRIQNYAMCLMDYEYHVLHPAFLVHAPGFKRFNPKSKETQQKSKYVAVTNKVIRNEIKPEYMILYGKNNKCSV